MHLYLLRHADADTVAATDDARALSEKGRAQAQAVAKFCAAQGISPAPLLASPVLRAAQTAAMVATHLGLEPVEASWLSCGLHPETAVEELRAYREQPQVMLVGHEPDLGRLAAHLLGISSGPGIHVRKASLTLLEIFTLRPGQARLEFSLPCKFL